MALDTHKPRIRRATSVAPIHPKLLELKAPEEAFLLTDQAKGTVLAFRFISGRELAGKVHLTQKFIVTVERLDGSRVLLCKNSLEFVEVAQ